MGFLMAAYGKLMTKRLINNITFQMMGIQSRLRRVQNEITNRTKMYESQERNMKNTMQTQMQYSLFGYAQSQGLPAMNPGAGMYGTGIYGQQCTAIANMGAMDYGKWQQYSMFQQQIQMQFAQAQSMWQDSFEMQKNADLQALKDLENSLETEKASLESRLKLAENEYQAYKDQEKSSAKDLTPEYTSQG